MKNILFIHSSSELYGSDRSLLNIIKNINKSKYNIYVVLPTDGPLVEEITEVQGVTVDIFEVAVLRRCNLSLKGGIKYVNDFKKSIKFLREYIKKYNISLVDTNTAVVFPGAIAAKREKVKSVWHIREIINNRVENSIISFVMKKYADIIIANSESTKKALNVDPRSVRVVYNAVEEKKCIKEKNNENIVIGMAGRINRWKGQKLFVDAAELVSIKYPEVSFLIAGEAYRGEEYLKRELYEYIESKSLNRNVILMGQVDDMSRFYSSLDVFVLPSIQPEPFGLVVIEAMEFGLPVIATNHGGPTEIISDKVDGYLVDYKNAEQMAECIIELISDDEKRKLMGIRGKEKKRNIFSIEAMVTNLESIFDELC